MCSYIAVFEWDWTACDRHSNNVVNKAKKRDKAVYINKDKMFISQGTAVLVSKKMIHTWIDIVVQYSAVAKDKINC